VTRSGGANLSDVAVIDAGTLHTCAVTRDLAAWCWGNNRDGQLGDGTATFKRRAVRVTKAGSPLGGVEPLGGIVGISAGGWHSCAAARDGAAWCWGEGSLGQVGGEDIYSDNFYRAVRVVPTWAQ
jgi:alpha-tubulin suppressor-like RCC1 family protein